MRLPITTIPAAGERIAEKEITQPVNLCLPSGRLNPDAVGWTRTALHRTALRGWGRNKRFEYWCVITPTHIVSLNISHHDYRANVSVTSVDRSSYGEIRQGGNTWLPRRGGLTDAAGGAPMQASRKDVTVCLTPDGTGMLLNANSARISVDLAITGEPGHESMGVVVPWTSRRFQYTKKDNCLRAEGTVVIDGVEHRVKAADTYAVHDRGRGRWPYFTLWNWGAGNGRDALDREIGLQFGGKWTDGTPSTENWIRIDGRLTKISSHLSWQYDPKAWLTPWRLVGPGVNVTFTPVHHSQYLFNRWIVKNRADTCFGHYSGTVNLDEGEDVQFSGIFGHVEEVERRW